MCNVHNFLEMNVEQEPRETNDPDDRDACEALLFRHHPAPTILLFLFLYSLGRRDRWPSQSHEWTRTTFINSYDFRPVESPFSLYKQRLKELRIHFSWGVVNCLVYTVVSLTFLFIWLVNISYGGGKEKKSRFNTTNKTRQSKWWWNHTDIYCWLNSFFFPFCVIPSS